MQTLPFPFNYEPRISAHITSFYCLVLARVIQA